MRFKRDPGPCPVDDAPHHTCVSPDYGTAIVAGPIIPATVVVVPVPSANAAPPLTEPPSPTFTTKTYRGRNAR